MTILFDTKQKSWVDVPEEQVSGLVGSGEFAFRRGVRVPVQLPDGTRGTVDPTDAVSVFRDGGQFETGAMTRALTEQRIQASRAEIFDQPGTALAAGVLRGATFGASDALARTLGGEDMAEDLRTVRELSPVASGIGEVAGSLLGPSALGAARAGKAAAGLVRGTGVASRIGASAASGLTEGALFGTGNVISDAALGDPELSAQKAFLTIGGGALLGGGIGALTKGGQETLVGLRDALKASTVPTATADVIGKAYAKLASVTRDLPKDQADDLQRIFTRDRKLVAEALDNPDVVQKKAIDAFSSVREIGKTIDEAAIAARAAARDQLKTQSVGFAKNNARMLLKSFDDAIAAVEKKPAYFKGDTATILSQIRSDLQTSLKGAQSRGDVHEIVETWRKKLDDYIPWGKDAKRGPEGESRKLMEGIRGKMAEHLTDANLYGDFANTYASINNAYSTYRTMAKTFDKALTAERLGMGGYPTREIDPQKVLAWVRSPDDLKRMEKALKLQDLAKSVQNLGDVTRAAGGNAAQMQLLATRVSDSLGAIESVKDVRGLSILLNRIESFTGKSLQPSMLGGLAGATVAGPVGAAIGGAIGAAVANPRTVLRLLNKLDNVGLAGQQKVQAGVASMLGLKALKAAGTLASQTAPRVGVASFLQIMEAQEDGGKPEERLKKVLDEYISDPHKLDERFVRANPYLDSVSPATYAQALTTLSRGMQFLYSKLPQPQPGEMFGASRELSRFEKQRLETYVDATLRPERLLEELSTKAPDPAVVEAVQFVYPRLFSEVQSEVLKQATENADKLTYREKLAIGKAFAIPTTPDLLNTAQIQSMYAVPLMPRQDKSAVSIAMETATPYQKIMNQ